MLVQRSENRAHRVGGFTLVEMILSAGVVMVLVGLCVPALARSRENARMARDLALMRQCGVLLQGYCTDSRGVFPIYGSGTWSVYEWWKAVGPISGISSAAALDPSGVREVGEVRAYMSACLVVDPDLMTPGNTVHIDLVSATPIRDAQVAYPALKGTLFMQTRLALGQIRHWAWTPEAPQAPITFMDGSAQVARWTDFDIEPAFFEHWVGGPVYSTWGGVRGRDVRR